MQHTFKAKLKKILYGVYTYGFELTCPDLSFKKVRRFYDGRNYSFNNDADFQKVTGSSQKTVGNATQPVQTVYAEERIEKILSELPAGWGHSILVIAPFRISLLTAMLITKTEKPCRIRYTVKGIRGSKDLSYGEEDFQTSHRVPIIGLFEDAINKVTITVEDEATHRKTGHSIRIKTPSCLREVYEAELTMTYSAHDITDEEEHFYEVSGGYLCPTGVFDSHANLRAFFSRVPQYYGIYMLDGGTFLYPERMLKRPVFGAPLSVVTHEMDWLGRYHHTYYHEIGFHHDAVELPDGNILTISSSLVDTYVENDIIKIDRNTGEELDRISMNELFDDTYVTRYDWCHVNSISLMDDPDELILCMRNIHSICRVSLRERKLIWILTNPEMFKGTGQEDLQLTPEGDFGPWFFQQHSAKIMRNFPNADPNRLYITFYDNHDARRRPVDWYDEPGTSYGLIVSVDEQARTFRLEKRFPTNYAITRANTIYDEKTNHFYTMDARIETAPEVAVSDMREWDFDTGELIREYKLNKDFFAIHPMEFDYAALSKPLEKGRRLFRGHLTRPVRCDRPEDLDEWPLLPKSVKDKEDILFYRYGNHFIVWALDQQIKRVILADDKNKEQCYHIDFSVVGNGIPLEQPIKHLKEVYYWHLFPLEEIPDGRYTVYIVFQDQPYRTDNTVIITK